MILAVPDCELFGAGTCGKYLLREFAKRGPVRWHPMGEVVDAEFPAEPLTCDIGAPLFQIAGPELEPQIAYRGAPTIGYVFSEWAPLTKKQCDNLKKFDVLVAGSEWNARVVRDAVFDCVAVPQGVDRAVWHPMARKYDSPWLEDFVVFSGGKFESRKAQDLVLRAVKILQQRHADIMLVASWVNLFSGEDGYADAIRSGVRMAGLPLLSHSKLANAMSQTDVGLFPNRCEGGTNLVLMQYLAMGKPVVANAGTGQRDVLAPGYAVMCEGGDDEQVEAMAEGVDFFYQHRGTMAQMGRDASDAMDAFPWSRTADGIVNAMELVAA